MTELRWTQPEWLASARGWIVSEMEAKGRAITGDLTQPHIRPWSTAIRIPTAGRPVWFKAGTAALAHEAALTPFLASLMPEHSPVVIAQRSDIGWLLLEDLGQPLREKINEVADLHWWHQVTDLYSVLQQRAAREFEALRQTGIVDRRRAQLREQWDALLDDTDSLMVDEPDGLAEAQYRRALELWPEVQTLIEESECAGLPYTVVHEDLHDANVFVKEGTLIIADWGDSSIANPLATLTVMLNSAAHRRGLATDSPPIAAIRDRYLDRWRDYAEQPVLVRAATAATRLGMLYRSLCWRDSIRSAPAEFTAEWAEAVPGWLDEFISTFDA